MIDPGTMMAVSGLLSGTGLDLNGLLSRVLAMQGGSSQVDPAELAEIREEISRLGQELIAGGKALREREDVLSTRTEKRDALHADANASHDALKAAMRAAKEREQAT